MNMMTMNTLLKTACGIAAAFVLLTPVAQADYWISSTGKTHNSSCRYYEKGKGRLSPKPTKVNCKICNGAARKPLFDEESIKAAREHIEEVQRDKQEQPAAAAPAQPAS